MGVTPRFDETVGEMLTALVDALLTMPGCPPAVQARLMELQLTENNAARVAVAKALSSICRELQREIPAP